MLYKQKNTEVLDDALFQNPSSEYRATPFWAWNCELEEKELLWQIECFKKMGFGGFHMHTRSGMATPYLSDEFMKLVKSCTAKAKEENMLAYLYDEDRWPSGAAGGFVTKTPEYRQRMLFFTTNEHFDTEPKERAVANGTPYFLGKYDIILNQNGELVSYRLLAENEVAEGTLWSAYCITPEPSGWYNGETYADTLNPKAIQKFIEITYEAYEKAVGEEFGKTVPSIFTDEPQFSFKKTLPFAESIENVWLPWTPDFDESYRNAYSEDILEKLPELFWELPNGEVSVARYHYHDHICERFSSAFADFCGAWCDAHNLYLTGHMMEEPTLYSQTTAIGEAMRAYRSFTLPGIDMLMNRREYSTAKQAQSAAHQYGREGVLSELYGVTNWDFDFRGHKFQGDWQAALGVTVRVPHLSWVSMKGSAKRDYPASIHYQSPWYEQYSYIENHFARLATALTRGKPQVKVGVIHPIESYWLHWGPSENTSAIRKQMDQNFSDFIEWLLFDTIDFDFISESCLPSLCGEIDKELAVGEMNYSSVIVPNCETLRQSTINILRKFIQKGGKVIFAGACPKYVDARPSDAAQELYNSAVTVPFEKLPILNALSDERTIEIKLENGEVAENFLYNMRKDGEDFWLFLANARPERCNFEWYSDYRIRADIRLKIRGEFTPILYDTLNGEIKEIAFEIQNGCTVIHHAFYENDSLLLRLRPYSQKTLTLPSKEESVLAKIDWKEKVSYCREEENVCLLDLAKWRFDGGEMQESEEILRIDNNIRKQTGWTLASGEDVQPWLIKNETPSHSASLYFSFDSEEAFANTFFCAEELVSLKLNGTEVGLIESGYYVDKSIKRYALPALAKGKNEIVARVPIGKRISLEACYLIGDFDVVLAGCEKTLTAPSSKISFGDITHQGMPFYGGNLIYETEIEVKESCTLSVNNAKYIGSLVKVSLDGKDCGFNTFEPYNLQIENVSAGKHKLCFHLFGNRMNTFGGLHNAQEDNHWYGPTYWYSKDENWSYEYNLRKTGILKSPVVTVLK